MNLNRSAAGGGGDTSGFTLVELLVSTTAFLLILAAALALLPMMLRSESRVSERSARIQEGRVLIERLTRELRQGSEVQSATSTSVAFITFVHRTACGGTTPGDARQCLVTYACSGATCTRTERNPDGSGSAEPVQLVDGLQSASFGYLPSATAPEYVSAKLALPAERGDDAITLQDGVNLRNAGFAR